MLKIKPMLCEEAQPFDSDDYIYEAKLNGIRCIAVYPDAILDGEIVCLGTDGMPDFNRIQHRVHLQDADKIANLIKLYPATYEVFDILHAEEHGPLTMVDLELRKNILSRVLDRGLYDKPILYSRSGRVITNAFPDIQLKEVKYLRGKGKLLFDTMKACDGEGIVAKPLRSHYVPNNRGIWIKSKIWHEGVFTVCGVTEGKNGRVGKLGALVLGRLEQGKMVYHGEAGSGLTDNDVATLPAILNASAGCPFDKEPKVKDLVSWIKPELEVEIQYFKLQDNGRLIFPSIKRIRR